MNQIDIKERIIHALQPGAILLVVPPFATTRTPILGPLLLKRVGEILGFKTSILHLNLLLAAVIGVDTYEDICFNQPFRMLGERLFARSAYNLPPLGKNTELCTESMAAVFGQAGRQPIKEFEYKFYKTKDFKLAAYLGLEETCFSFINSAALGIAAMGYKITGCSSNWEQNNASLALLEKIKQTMPGIITIMGGSNCEGEMAEGLSALNGAPDYIFSGESERSFAAFLSAYSAGKLPDNKVIYGEAVAMTDDFPACLLESYVTQRELFLGAEHLYQWNISYESSRGCWWDNCHFCGLNGVHRGGFRVKSPDKVSKELAELHKQYPRQAIAMIDKVMPPSYLKTLLPVLAEKEDLPAMSYEQRSDLELAGLIQLKKSGFVSIKPGIEALSDGLLQLMNKGVTAAQNLLLLRHAMSLGIYVDWNMLWGFPGDKEEYYLETLRLLPLIKHLCPPAVFRHLSLDRFSPYWKQPGVFGITGLRPWAAYAAVYPGEAELSKLAYRFTGDYASAAHACPALIAGIGAAIKSWKDAWKKTRLALMGFDGSYMIADNRAEPDKPETFLLDRAKAKEVMCYALYTGSPHQAWAVANGFGVIIKDEYIPLITAPYNLLLEFESPVGAKLSSPGSCRHAE